jgi:bacterioferritin
MPDLKAAISYCESAGDFVSRQLFVDILASEEEHIDWLETQLGLIAQLGEANYLQTKIGS